VESAETFAGTEYVRVVVDCFVFVVFETVEDFNSLYHANSTLHGAGGFHAADSVTLP
jgi:hypothetical protein